MKQFFETNFQMYSGYYQYEVKANLIDAERMFEAMGYTLLPNQTLVLDGPICPDQVTNVSRDAMAAYVECQVIIFTVAQLVGLFCYRPISILIYYWIVIVLLDYEADIPGFDCDAIANFMARNIRI